MDPKLYLLAFFATVLLNNWKFAHGDEHLTRIIHKLDELKISIEQNLRSEVGAMRMALQTDIAVWKSTLESKVDRVLNEIQGSRDHVATRGKLLILTIIIILLLLLSNFVRKGKICKKKKKISPLFSDVSHSKWELRLINTLTAIKS